LIANRTSLRRGRAGGRTRRGNALIEFLLTVPILGFMMALTVYMSFAMLTRQQAIIEARAKLWHSVNNDAWSAMKLEGYDPNAGGAPPQTGWGDKPRGSGEELTRLQPDIQQTTIARVSSAKGRDYWERLWENLPGRSDIKVSRSFKTSGTVWDFIDHNASGDHTRDSSAWHFYHLDAWKIARSGPLSEIFNAFDKNMNTEGGLGFFDKTRDDIIKRWWHGTDILDSEMNSGTGAAGAGN
jgi:hypothetical protein